jgi:hypothetical protein
VVGDLVRTRQAVQSDRVSFLDWLGIEHGLEKPGQRLEAPFELTSDELVAEVKKRRGKKGLSAAALKSLREEYARTVEPIRETVGRALQLERRLAGLVDEAYGLTAEEVALVWRTAPPPMPIPNPVQD